VPVAVAKPPEYGIIVVVCGSRATTDRKWVFAELDRIDAQRRIGAVIEGGQRKYERGKPVGGVDFLSREWAVERNRDWTTVSADWTRLMRAAGPLRNERMATILARYAAVGQPVALVRFPGGAGTANMDRCARGKAIEVIEIAAQGTEARRAET